MQLKPLHDRVLVKRMTEEDKTKGGIIIPDTAKEKQAQGEVVATGPGRRAEDGKLMAMEVKLGDKVLFGKYAGTEIKIDGEEYTVISETDVYCVLQ
jgi:chaperonin GroES